MRQSSAVASQLARYRLLRRIGVGGMAEVFRAELVGAEGVTRELVVKKMHPTLALDPTAVAMFVEEARLAARLQHPNVVQVYEFGKADDDYFLAMELVDGCDLATLLRAAAGPLPVALAGFIASELLEGLAHVHALADPTGAPLGLVHRDVSPHNVLLGRNGEVKLADFGIAKAAARIGRETGQTGVGVKGKFAYMPPEQARGASLDARADLFAVGAILFEMLTGARVYAARPDGDLVDAVRSGRVRAAREVAPGLDAGLAAVVDRAVDPHRERRFESARQMRQSLLDALDALGVRPSRGLLRERVLAVLQTDPSPPERPERTLTAQDDPAPSAASPRAPEPVAPRAPEAGAAAPGSMPSLSAGLAPAPRRKLLERIAIAIGVFTVAVLAERRTRPLPTAPRAPAPTGALETVRVRWAEGADPARWLTPALRAQVEARCGCRIEADASAPMLELLDAAGLAARVRQDSVRRLDTFLAEVDAPGLVDLQAALRDDARRLGAASGAAGEGTYLLAATVDAVALAVRVEAMQRLGDAAQARQAVVALGAQCGASLPEPSGFRADPTAWTIHDLAAAAAVWRTVAPPMRLRVPWEGLAARGVAAARGVTFDLDGAHGDDLIAQGPSLTALRLWDERLTAAGALDPTGPVWQPDSAAVIVRASDFVASDEPAEAWQLHRLPRGDSLARDATGEARQVGSRAQSGAVMGWVLARGASASAARLLLALSGPEVSAALASWLYALPARRDVDPSRRVADGARRARYVRALAYDAMVLEGGRFGPVGFTGGGDGGDAFVDARRRVLAARSGRCAP